MRKRPVPVRGRAASLWCVWSTASDDEHLAVGGEQELLHSQAQQVAGEVLLAPDTEDQQFGLLLLDHIQQDVGAVVLGRLLAYGDAHGRAAPLIAGDLELDRKSVV